MREAPARVRSVADARAIVEARGLDDVKIGVFDIDGVLRGKTISREKFDSALAGGLGFCDVVLGWDTNDQLYDNVEVTGWHTGYPDATVRLLPHTCRELPLEDGALLFLGEFAGAAESVCPRAVLRRTVERAHALGLRPQAACEFEFFLFEESPHSVREKGYRGLQPLSPGYFGYSVLRSSVHAELHRALLSTCRQMRMPLEGLHTETGPGVLEAALSHCDALEAADRAALFKTHTKVLAQRLGKMATFMARWSADWPGQSGHIHLSLEDEAGEPVFHDPREPNAMSERMRHFLGGQLALLPQLLAMMAPTVNSYRRLVPGFWAPTHASWGIENRTCALRAILGKPSAQRVENRVAGADINPYLAIAAALGSGLWGIEHRIEPGPPVEGDAYRRKFPARRRLAASLADSAEQLRRSRAARELFGEAFVDHYAATRQWEVREHRRAVSDWELARYFEII